MRAFTVALVSLLAGCASAGAPDSAESPARVITAGESVDIRVTGNEEALRRRLAASPEEVWQALPGVFEALGIPVTHIDTRSRIIGNRRHSAGRTIGGEPLRTYLSCGSTMTGPVTSTHDVRLSLLVEVLPWEGGVTQLQSAVGGSAFSRQGVSGGPIACSSTGRLEQRIADMLNQKVAR